jgi:very-short-patch-repair endonuclease
LVAEEWMAERNGTWRSKPEQWHRLRAVVRALRRAPTAAEAALWEHLRAGRLDGVKFRRQHALDRFVVDFYAPAYRLALEVDGGVHHARQDADAVREAYLSRLGVVVLRVRNEEVESDLAGVLNTIRRCVTGAGRSA